MGMKPVRACTIIQFFEIGGIARMVLDLGRGLLAHGIRTTVVAYLADGPVRGAMERAGLDTAFVDAGGAGLKPQLVWRLRRFLRSHDFDLVHSHHMGPFLYGGMAARLCGLPQVHTEHSCELYDTPRRKLLGHLMGRCATVATVSEELSRWRRQAFRGTACHTIPNGVHVPADVPDGAAARRRLGLGPDDFVIGCVARLSPEKDHLTLIRAFGALADRHPEAQLVLVGDGCERARIEAAARGLRVRLLGQVEQVSEVLPAFDVIALSSVREGLPLALLEAMACSMPVVATDVGGIGDLLSTGGGVVVPVRDPAGLGDALSLYASQPERRRSDGAFARALVRERYDSARMAERYAALYREVCR